MFTEYIGICVVVLKTIEISGMCLFSANTKTMTSKQFIYLITCKEAVVCHNFGKVMTQ